MTVKLSSKYICIIIRDSVQYNSCIIIILFFMVVEYAMKLIMMCCNVDIDFS